MPTSESGQIPLSVADRVVLAFLAAVLLFTPIALGTVQPWSEEVFHVLAAAIAAVTAVRILRRPQGGSCPWWVVIPVIGFPVLVGLQLVPWRPLLSAISPGALDIRRELAAPFIGEDAALRGATISLYAEETWRHLRLLLSVIAVFLGALLVARTRAAIRFLLSVMMIAGVVVASIAAAHAMFGIEKVYGLVVRPPRAGDTSAPFINRNHFAQFLNMSIGASLAMLLKAVSAAIQEYSPRRPREWLELAQQGLLRKTALPVVAIIFCSASVVMSGSRGGAAALLGASVITAAASARRRSARTVTTIFAGGMVVLAVGAFFASPRLQERLRLIAQQDADGGRLELLQGQAHIWREFPVVGVGLGTFEYVFPRYDTTRPINIASHAENDYAQTLTETGGVGLALLLWFMACVWTAYASTVRRGGRGGLIALGLGFGLAAVTIHSAVDFGQRLPANASMTAVAAAILIAMTRPVGGEGDKSNGGWRRWTLPPFIGVLVVMLIILLPQADAHRRAAADVARSESLAATLQARRFQGTTAEFAAMVDSAHRAAAIRPADARAQYAAGFAEYWSLMRERRARFDPDADQQAVASVLERFHAAMALAPLFGPPYSMAGQIELSRGNNERGSALILRAAELAPQDGWSAVVAGELLLRQGKSAEAVKLFQRAAATSGIDPNYVLLRLINVYNRLDLAYQFAGDSRYLNETIVGELRRQNRTADLAAANDRLLRIAMNDADANNAPADRSASAAEMLIRNGRSTDAIRYLRRAVGLNPGQREWRLQLAKTLFAINDVSAAEQEISAVLRDHPEWVEARELGATIRLRAATMPSP